MFNSYKIGVYFLSVFIFVPWSSPRMSQVTGDKPPPIGDGQCVWYDTCDENPDKPGLFMNCYYPGEAKLLEDGNAKDVLVESCPELVDEIAEDDGSLYTCCSPTSIDIMAQQLTLLNSVLGSCPSCLSNLRQNFCYLACHPRQSSFLNPQSLVHNKTTDMESVESVTYYMSQEYAYSTYDSCDKVYYAALSEPALVLLCGPWGLDGCTPERLFAYFGTSEFSPFDILYEFSDENATAVTVENETATFQPFNVEVIPCNTTLTGMHCLCSDCSESCPAAPDPVPPPDYVMVGEIRLYVFLLAIIYFLLAVPFVVFGFWKGLPGRSPDEHKYLSFNHKYTASIEEHLEEGFVKLAKCITKYPYVVMVAGVVVIGVLATGLTQLELTTDPVELWAAPDSRTRKEKDYYDKNFGPFYRTNQVIITSKGLDFFDHTITDKNTGVDMNYTFGPVFHEDFMLQVFDLQAQIMNITGKNGDKTVYLVDICIKPLAPVYTDCLIQSVMNYWQNDRDTLYNMMYDADGNQTYVYLEHLINCVSNPTYFGAEGSCLGSYGGPVFPYVALGGYLEDGEIISESPSYEEATALVLTFLGQNYVDDDDIEDALAWEEEYLKFMEDYENPMMDFAYYAERSIEDEIIRESQSDVVTILISYLVMFAYVSLSLGNYGSDCSRLLIETKLTLGLCSVILVFSSVIASVGLCAFLGVESTLIVIEVIPFLVLAVGVDNIFLLVQTLEREELGPNESVEDHVAKMVGKIGPSMLLSTCSEAVCFFLGALTEMPAVHSFALYAGVALTLDFLLQMTFLIALIAIDAKRQNANRYDLVCCIKGPKEKEGVNTDVCFSFFGSVYAPFLLSDVVRIIVMLVFFGGFFAAFGAIPYMDVGLEQDIGMPDDSYVLKYFDFMADYLSVGPPVYFVVKEDYDYPEIDQQNLVCSSSGCQDDSMLTQIFVASKSPDITYIATGASSWLDSYLSWISDTGSGSPALACCRLDENGTFVNSSEAYDLNAVSTCLQDGDFVNGTTRPYPYLFMEYLPDFLKDNPHGDYCSQAGHPAYGTAVVILYENEGDDSYNNSYVGANYYMAYHTILKVSKDFTEALEEAYELTDQLTEYLQERSSNPDIEVFPYSIFYVYYEQYLTMGATASKSLGVSFISVMLVMLLLTGLDVRSTCVNLLVILMITVDIMGFMIPWGIQLNAISVVNLVMSIGISVEFCSHMTHAFMFSSLPTRVERAKHALTHTGSSVLSGITLTKFAGIIVLAFANSQVITVFYFRMYLMIVLVGAAHGLILLPVLLSLIGPSLNTYVKHKADEEGKTMSEKKSNNHKISEQENKSPIKNCSEKGANDHSKDSTQESACYISPVFNSSEENKTEDNDPTYL